MIRIKGRYHNQVLELDQPLNLADGTVVEVEVHAPDRHGESPAKVSPG